MITQSRVVFSVLCDSSIYKFSVSLKEEISINPSHDFWKNEDNYLIVNVTQLNIFSNMTSNTELNLRVSKKGEGLHTRSLALSSITIVITLISSILIMRFFCTER